MCMTESLQVLYLIFSVDGKRQNGRKRKRMVNIVGKENTSTDEDGCQNGGHYFIMGLPMAENTRRH